MLEPMSLDSKESWRKEKIAFICKISFSLVTRVILIMLISPKIFFFPFMILSAIQEAMNMEFSNPTEGRYVTQLAMKFHHIWGKLPSI